MMIQELVALVASLASLSLASTPCDNAAPFFHKMLRGVDITEMDLLPLTLSANDGFRSPIIDMTCGRTDKNHESTFVPDEITKKTSYQVPDQIHQVVQMSSSDKSTDVCVMKSSSEIRDSFSQSVEISGQGEKKGKTGSASASASFSSMQSTITNDMQYVYELINNIIKFKVTMETESSVYFHLGKYAKMLINMTLTDKYTKNAKAYHDFIDEFGTHYVSEGNLGGVIRLLTKVDRSYAEQASGTDIKAHVKFEMEGKTGGGSGEASASGGNSNQNAEITKNSSTELRYYGGCKDVLKKTNNADEWMDTINENLWLTSCTLTPISDLIDDKFIKASMELAVEQYIMKRKLDQVQSLVEMKYQSICGHFSKWIKNFREQNKLLKPWEVDHLHEIAEDCVKTASSDCYNGIGKEYMGPKRETKDGVLCQRWESQTPHPTEPFTGDNFPEGRFPANLCRNPDDEPNGPWCYTTDPGTRWAYCGVPKCSPETCYTGKGYFYTGKHAESISGKECMTWPALWDIRDFDKSNPHNYCRNFGIFDFEEPFCFVKEIWFEHSNIKFYTKPFPEKCGIKKCVRRGIPKY